MEAGIYICNTVMESKGKKILIADDEPDILEILEYNLTVEGYTVVKAKDGDEALDLAKKQQPDLIILDVMMPRKTGMDVCQILRSQPAFADTRIIMLTALNDEANHIKGLEMGADDYVSKPISPKVLISRVNALFRRTFKDDDTIIKVGDLQIDKEQFMVKYQGQDIVLAKKEFELLSFLAKNPNKVFNRDELLEKVWGSDVFVVERTVDVHIRKLREKIPEYYIKTLKGVGYLFSIEKA